jgi:hypothetical protein
MKSALIAIGVMFGVFLALALITATPLVGEVVTLHTRSGNGDWETTPLWIVDTADGSYLRAGSPEGSGWVLRWYDDPSVKLERDGEVSDVVLQAEPQKRQAINDRMAERYGWADGFVGIMGDRSASLPLRVEFVGAGS